MNVFWSELHRFRRILWGALVLAAVLGTGALLRLDTVHPAQARVPRRAGLRAAGAGTAAAGISPITALRTPVQSGHWLASWAASPQGPVGGNPSAGGFRNQTLREVVFLSGGGSMVRIRLTNTFGARPLDVGRASLAVQAAGARLRGGTVRGVTFAGQPSVLVPPGAQVLSDPVRLAVAPLSHLVISLYLPTATGPATEHVQARQTGYVAAGNRALQRTAAGFAARTQSWYFLAGADVRAPARYKGAVVALGDSITDGVGSPLNANARWPNDLARRLAVLPGNTLTVVDSGIGGNRVLNDSSCCGLNAVARFGPDVLGQSGVRDVILLEGVNDIGYSRSLATDQAPHTNVSPLQIVDGYEQMIAMAHAAGLKVFGATLTPFRGARYWTAQGEAKRQVINRWIETSRAFDGVINFAAALAQPGHPERLRPAYDSGDHLHPNAAGYRAMANVVNLAKLTGSR